MNYNNIRTALKIAAMGTVAFGLNGCFESQEAPSCSDGRVTEMVQQIYADHMKSAGGENIFAQVFLAAAPGRIAKIDVARAVAYDEKLKLRSCKAEATFENNATSPIEYTVQLDEKDPEQMYIELKLDFLEQLMQQGMMQQFMNKMK